MYFSRAHEIANEARRVNKQLKECQTQVQLFNKRERLFHLSVTNVSHASAFYIYIFHCVN